MKEPVPQGSQTATWRAVIGLRPVLGDLGLALLVQLPVATQQGSRLLDDPAVAAGAGIRGEGWDGGKTARLDLRRH